MAVRALIILAALGAPAAAQVIAHDEPKPVRAPEPEPVVPSGPAWHFGLSFGGGAEGIGGDTFGQIGITVDVERRLVSRLALVGQVDLLTTNRTREDYSLIIGSTLRGIAGLGFTAWRKQHVLAPEVVVLGGVGRETTGWDCGAVARDLVFAGVLARGTFEIPEHGVLHGISRMGMVIGFRIQVAPALEPMAIARACSQCGASTDRGHDLAFLFHYGLDFGR